MEGTPDPITGGILNETIFNTSDVFEAFDTYRAVPNFTFEELDNQNSFYFKLEENDLLFHPASSFFEIRVTFKKTDAADVWSDFAPAFLCFQHFFREIRYELNGYQVDKVNMPGMAWAPFESLTHNFNDESRVVSGSFLQFIGGDFTTPNQVGLEISTTEIEYVFLVDLGQLFPIFRQWRGMYWASTHKFIFIRNNNLNDTFVTRGGATGFGTITPKLKSIYLNYRKPKFTPVNDMNMKNALLSGKSQRMEFQGFIYNNIPLGTVSNHYELLINEETVRCRHMVFWFQKQSNENNGQRQTFHPETTDIQRISIDYDGQHYPQIPVFRPDELDMFSYYKDVADTARSFSPSRQCDITPATWRTNLQMFCMDLGAHKDIIAESRMKLRLHIEFKTNKTDDYRLHYVLFVDRIAVCNYNGQGRILQSETSTIQ